MVAVTKNVNTPIDVVVTPEGETEKVVSLKHKQRLEEQKIREAKKMAKRHEKQLLKERRANEKEWKHQEREKRLEEFKALEGEGLTFKEQLEEQRLQEEQAMIEAELAADDTRRRHLPTKHVKKSTLDSNRLGGHSMA